MKKVKFWNTLNDDGTNNYSEFHITPSIGISIWRKHPDESRKMGVYVYMCWLNVGMTMILKKTN